MATEKLFIPEKIKVGYQKRDGTYTGKLAYVIYFDKTGKLRKETSWNSWRDKKIEPQEFTNEPFEGFVLNKGVGGTRGSSSSWNVRNEYIRVYDPRGKSGEGFEFEISVANLLFILKECDCSRGKGLEGKFVYAWDKTELVLLPASSLDYRQSREFTDLQGKTVKARSMIAGATYATKKAEHLIYLGKFDYFNIPGRSYGNYDKNGNKIPDIVETTQRFVFWDGKQFVCLKDVKPLAALMSEEVVPNFAKLVSKYGRTPHGCQVKEFFLREVPAKTKPDHAYRGEEWCYESEPGVFQTCSTSFKWAYVKESDGMQRGRYTDEVEQVSLCWTWTIEDGKVVRRPANQVMYPSGSKSVGHHYHGHTVVPYVTPTIHRLFVRLTNGAEHRVDYNTFHQE